MNSLEDAFVNIGMDEYKFLGEIGDQNLKYQNFNQLEVPEDILRKSKKILILF
jgi:hypothetical protein